MHKKSKYIFWTISLLLIAALWLFQNKISVNIPWWDDFHGIILPVFHLFSDLPFLEKIKLFFSLNNEHRVVNDRIFLLLIYLISGNFELKALALLGFINLILIFLVLVKVSKPLFGNRLYLLPIALLIFHAQYFESLQSLMVPFQNFSVILYVFLTYYFLIYRKNKGLIPAFIFALLAIFSHGNGILAFLIGAIILFFNKRNKDFIVWSFLSVASIILYFWGYKKPEWSSGVSAFSQPLTALRYVFEFFGAYALNITDLSTRAKEVYSHPISELFGLFLVVTFLVIFLKKYPLLSKRRMEATDKLRHSKADQFIICVFGFVFATGLMIGISRTGFSMLSRYTINSSFMAIAVYIFLVSNIKRKKAIGIVTTIFCSIILIISYFNNYEIALFNRKNAVADGINFRKMGTWSNQYIDSSHISKLNPLLAEPYKLKKYIFPASVLDNYSTINSSITTEKLSYSINDGILEISGVLKENINPNAKEDGIYFSLENKEKQFIFPAINQKNNILKSILQRKYFSDFYRTIYPVKLIPKEKYNLFKIIVIDDKVYKYDLGKTCGPDAMIR
ncbi:hypothetical protein EGI26_04085 [Lacihabitans sp. CCS-44]|uniref:hypothetical protein n=1 Tax=Lacihabitans sp. CCS-44 TaxID=2487331 RepID=UPI0020CE6084|nr:hypothetical protein [Lacihabitans sp. CCS-44]MCP9754344.1 hypothetical protein [Lacihabitans sp. CCS-44]